MSNALNLEVIYKPIAELSPRGRNPRIHSKKQIRQVARSIEQFGFLNPVLVDGDMATMTSDYE